MPKFIGFLIYDSRSGSTLLASLLDAHAELFVSLEAEYPLSAMEHVRRHGHPPENAALRDLLLQDRRLTEWDFDAISLFDEMVDEMSKEMAESGSSVTLTAFTSRLLEKAARLTKGSGQEPKGVILKQGLLSHYLTELRSVWPDAPLLHIYRDGRAVFASKKNAVNVDSNKPMASVPLQAAHRWVRIQRTIRSLPGGNLHHVAYERLLTEGDAVLDELWRFLGVASIPIVQLDASAYARRIPGSQKKIHTLVGRTPDASRMEAWRRDLSLADIWRYERAAAAQLVDCGYRPVFSSPKTLLPMVTERVKRHLWGMRSGRKARLGS